MVLRDAENIFAEERPRLVSLAYRLLGTVEEAEDVVQETWLRYQQADRVEIVNPAAWLTTVATRIGLDRMRSAKSRRETYVGPWLPEPMAGDPLLESSTDPAEQLILAESVSIGFLSLLERLSATERAVFVLREVFGVPMAEVAATIDKSEPATRQIAKRARDRVRAERPRFTPDPDDVEELTAAFMTTLMSGDLDAFTELLTDDVVAVSDGGANYRAARVPVVGKGRVGRFLINLYAKYLGGLDPEDVESIGIHDLRISGQPCTYVTRLDPTTNEHQPYLLIVLNWSDSKLHSMAIILNVDKLRRVHEHWLSL